MRRVGPEAAPTPTAASDGAALTSSPVAGTGNSVPARRALIIVAAGSGERLGYGVPKAGVDLAGRPILSHVLDRIHGTSARFDAVVLVLPRDPASHQLLAALGEEFSLATGIPVLATSGGTNRSASVRAGIHRLTEDSRTQTWDPARTTVLIHDAARALAPDEVHDRVIDAVESGAAAVVPAVAVTDTIKRVSTESSATGPERVAETVPRGPLRAVQTPQGFTLELLQRAFDYVGVLPDVEAELLTDEAMIAEAMGVEVVIVSGSDLAVKITTPSDLIAVEALLKAETGAPVPQTQAQGAAAATVVLPRVGIGHDVHAFAADDEPRELWLAGLFWPDLQGLTGHSDGDAVAHACCDALFSAAGVGDLGVHFGADTIGTSRPELAGASGIDLLAEAARIVRAQGFEIGSIAVQFVGRRPKFGPRREEAQLALSSAAGAPVAISATTSDGLGFTGRGEGILATATAVVYTI